MRYRRLCTAVLSLGVAGMIAGCAAHRATSRSMPDNASQRADESPVLEIENHNWSDIVVFALHDGRSARLAQVTAGRSISVPLLPQHFSAMGTFRLAVHPIGGSDDYTSETLSLRTGSTVRLTVENTVARSSVGVW